MGVKQNVVVIGGGNGSAISLNAVKKFNDEFDISAIISMSDSGGSSGILREEFQTLPAGDIMRAVLALSTYDYPILKNIFHKNKFSVGGKMKNHNLGNLFLILGEQYSGNFIGTLRCLEEAVEAVGRVYPATLDKTQLAVELTNGDIIIGETKIDKPEYDKKFRIKKAWLEPKGTICEGAKEAIEKADYIILGPGSLYTSIISAILPQGFNEAFRKSSAKLIYVTGNGREANGETGPQCWSDFVLELQTYLPRKIDYLVYNNHQLNDLEKNNYCERRWELYQYDPENVTGYNIVAEDYERFGGGLCPDKLGLILAKLLDC